MGTGSGCIIISVAMTKSGGIYVGIDTSEEALALARENATSMNAIGKVHFASSALSDLFEPGTIDVFTANLPYIPTKVYDRLPRHIRDFEPRQALDGGPDGLGVIRDFIQDAEILLKPGGHIFIEIGNDQAKSVRETLNLLGFKAISVKKDFGGHDRIVTAQAGQ
jgi:release factor glutamine methyltransferase